MQQPNQQPAFRIAHLSDMHLQSPKSNILLFEQLLSQLENQDLAFIVNGGDCIMDALAKPKDEVAAQWQLWQDTVAKFPKLNWVHCLGNHDTWVVQGQEEDPLYGKNWPMQVHKLAQSYSSFNKNNWHFIILDSIMLSACPEMYRAELGQVQLAWLKNDLEANSDKPTCIISHIPILSAAAFLDGDNATTGQWLVPSKWMHIDAKAIVCLLSQHKQVKNCLSGHLHLLESVQYNGINYHCNGAVCGNWWEGDYQETQAGYALIDFYADGSYQLKYHPLA